MKHITIIGAGSWGSTLAGLIGDKGYDVRIWAREPEVVQEIQDKRTNRTYLPGISFSQTVHPTGDLAQAVNGAEIIIMAVPTTYLRQTANAVASHIKTAVTVVDVAKGLEEGTFKTMSMVLEDELPENTSIVALSGPNHAEEVSRKVPTATVIASKDKSCLKTVKDILQTEYFRVYTHQDVVGIEICGAVKNITAIAAGIGDGLGFGDNARGSIITYGLTEMNKLGRIFGAKRATCFGLAGVGDLVATCISKHSRNRFVGQKIAEGKSLEEIKQEMHGMVAEGIRTTKAVHEFAESKGIEMPLTSQIYKVLYEAKDLKAAIKDLINLI